MVEREFLSFTGARRAPGRRVFEFEGFGRLGKAARKREGTVLWPLTCKSRTLPS
ncbi:hypothetical protein AOX55_00002391 [Sinorhizobium fredii CCBAU 25509]|nr:hypothetical protein AOX55_00002391 [Sinorhizobium fredii CCBAU 25509]